MNPIKSIPLRLPPLPSAAELLRLYGIRASKHLSQNFLLDSKLQSKVVRASGRVKGCHIVEVGPGPGCLTRSIFEQGAYFVNIVEKDNRFNNSLELLKDATNNRLGIHNGDILKSNLEYLFPKQLSEAWDGPLPRFHIIGNLPFNIATPLIIKWLYEISTHSSAWVHGRVPMTLTFQEEVGQRMVAPPCNIQRSRLSILCQNWCEVKVKFTIPGKAFVPKPDVNVSIVKFIPRIEPIINLDFKLVNKVINVILSTRRKLCKNCVQNLFPVDLRNDMTKKILDIADIDPEKRPYELSITDFNRLCHAYYVIIEENPGLKSYNYRGIVNAKYF